MTTTTTIPTKSAVSGVNTSPAAEAAAKPPADLFWYKNAVIYQMHVRSFSDSNGDGIGDFNGLISKLDYLEDLGVTAIWLLPFYPSPLKDDGYDIGDYTSVNPMYGNIEQAKQFIAEAHRRKIRVITELVINHTSDQHAWFQRARRAPKGSPERDFYVWSDSPDKYAGVRIIFKDFEPSNWTFDHKAGQYYWHRFFSHQPDLNFDNLAVHAAVLDVCDFWMQAGVDGVRLDAVPYLYEREGTSCENLDETHAFLRKLRAHVDRYWPGRMLLAEANQWPEDAIAYFGNGDECHMNFHFPLMPRLFMSLRMEDRYPIIDILEQTPPLPPNAQWAMFLRNHDELTLEMVTDEERDYMWRVYASDPTARINMGIRRRLAPLLDNNRRKIELMNALLFSMPGTPVIYYGDEIGMGDNIFLGDRNGVRTPMQWSADRNGGFSRANPQQLFLPVIIDPQYNYETINVEGQLASPSSLLWWMKRLIALRKRHPVFGRGDIHFLTPSNPKVLAFLRRDDQEQILVVANLSRFSQPVQLDLPENIGAAPQEMFGNVKFPAVGDDGRYTLSVGPHGFYWFLLKAAKRTFGDGQTLASIQIGSIAPGGSPLDDLDFDRLVEAQLPDLLPTRRWFVSKARIIRTVRMVERVVIGRRGDVTPGDTIPTGGVRVIYLLSVEFTEGEPDIYALPLTIAPETVEPSASASTAPAALSATPAAAPIPAGVFLYVSDGGANRWTVQDGMVDPVFARLLLHATQDTSRFSGKYSVVAGRRLGGGPALDAAALPVKVPEREQSNSNVVFDERVILKLYRRLGDGMNPELEIGEHLTKVGFTNTAPVAGAIEVHGHGAPRTLAIVLGYVPNQGDAWAAFRDQAQRYYETLDTLTPEQVGALCMPGDGGCGGVDGPPPTDIAALLGEAMDRARLLGQRTAEMHAALADDRDDGAFTPEPYSAMYQRSMFQSMRNTTRQAMQSLLGAASSLQGEAQTLGRSLLERESKVLSLFRELTSHPIRAPRIRCHGDYHLGQVLWTGKDFIIIDFEGEPLRSVGERRLKRSPMRDVAGMVRSFDYAAWTALRRHEELLASSGNPAAHQRDVRGARVWSAWLAREFVRAYIIRLREIRADLLPASLADAELVLQSWVLEKALYEVRYELNSRPDWVDIPLRAVLAIVNASQQPASATIAGAEGSAAAEGNTASAQAGMAAAMHTPVDVPEKKDQ